MRTLQQARDARLPKRSCAVRLGHPLYFAGELSSWGDGGTAFIGAEPCHETPTLGRAYHITASQLCDVFAQENGQPVGSVTFDLGQLRLRGSLQPLPERHYGRLLLLGAIEDQPVVTLTAPVDTRLELRHPNQEYIMTIITGLLETYPALADGAELVTYLQRLSPTIASADLLKRWITECREVLVDSEHRCVCQVVTAGQSSTCVFTAAQYGQPVAACFHPKNAAHPRKEIIFDQLQRLKSRNLHHGFEDLCVDLAMETVYPHICPATGPVSAGGDQGRDFDTYPILSDANSSLIGFSDGSEVRSTFACTTEAAKSLRSKIRKDVKKIVSAGQPVERIYYYCAEALAVGYRNTLVEKTKKTHGVELCILDGWAIALELTRPQREWICRRHLALPDDYLDSPADLVAGRAMPQGAFFFVGRDQEIDQMRQLMLQPHVRLIQVVAPAGFGKTALVLHLLTVLRQQDDVLRNSTRTMLYYDFRQPQQVRLANVLEDLATSLGWQERARTIAAGDSIQSKLALLNSMLERLGRVWYVLDNFEQALDADDCIRDRELGTWLTHLLQTYSSARVLLTSRTLPVLSPNPAVAILRIGHGLSPEDAVRFLKHLLAQQCAELDAAVLQLIAEKTHGIPQALVTAAVIANAVSRGASPSARLADLDVKISDDLSELGRHLLGARMLTEEAQMLLEGIGQFQLPVSEKVLAHCFPQLDVSRTLEWLARRVLIARDNGSVDMHPFLHETLARCAFQAPPKTLHRRAARAFAQACQERSTWRTIRDIEPNLKRWDHLMRAGDYKEALKELGRLQKHALGLWGHYQEALDRRRALAQVDGLAPTDVVENLRAMAIPLIRLGDPDRAKAICEESLAHAEAAGSDRELMFCHNSLGIACLHLQRMDEAVAHYGRALALARQLESGEYIVLRLTNLAEACCKVALFDRAHQLLIEADNVFNSLGNTDLTTSRLFGLIRSNFGELHLRLGQYTEAQNAYEVARSLADSTGDVMRLAHRTLELARLALFKNETARALALAQDAARVYKDIGYRSGIGRAYLFLAQLAQTAGDYSATDSHLNTARENELSGIRAPIAFHRAVLEGATGDPQESRFQAQTALQATEQLLHHTPRLFKAQYCRAQTLLLLEKHDQALQAYQQCIADCPAEGVRQQYRLSLQTLATVPHVAKSPVWTTIEALL
jgi:tetratricopeptide (TPR) repeat protein